MSIWVYVLIAAFVFILVWFVARRDETGIEDVVKAEPERKSPDEAIAIANALIPLIEANDYTHEFHQGAYFWRFAGVKNLNVEVTWRFTTNNDSATEFLFLAPAWMPNLWVGGMHIEIRKDVRDILRKGWDIAEARREARINQGRENAMKSALSELQEYTPVRRKQPRKPNKTNK